MKRLSLLVEKSLRASKGHLNKPLRDTLVVFSLAAAPLAVFADCSTLNLSGFDTSPVVVEAENYCSMSGIQTDYIYSPYVDTPTGTFVGWTDAGDSLTYHINVPTNVTLPFSYTVSMQVAAPSDKPAAFDFGNANGSTTFDVPNTGGWQNWTTISKTLQFNKAGEQDIVLKVRNGGFNVDWIKFVAQSTAITPITVVRNEIFTRDDINTFLGYDLYSQKQFLSSKNIQRVVVPVEGSDGYIMNPALHNERIRTAVTAAVANKEYVIIDWSLAAAHLRQAEAINFFGDMARQYGKLNNVIYEINDKPDANTSWATDIKPYAQNVIYAIRQIDPDNLIIVGTPNRSQAVEQPAADPILGNNIAYALSFTLMGNSTTTRMNRNEESSQFRERILKALEANIPFVITDWTFDLGQNNQSSEYKEWSYFAGSAGIPSMGLDSTYFTHTISFNMCYNSLSPYGASPLGRHIISRYACTQSTNNYYLNTTSPYYFISADPVGEERVAYKLRFRSEGGAILSLIQSSRLMQVTIAPTGGQFKTIWFSAPRNDFNNADNRFVLDGLFNRSDIHWIEREQLSVAATNFATIDYDHASLTTDAKGDGALSFSGYLPTPCDELLPITTSWEFGRSFSVYVTANPNPGVTCPQVLAPFIKTIKVAVNTPIYLNEKLIGQLPPVTSSSSRTSSSAPSSSVVSTTSSSFAPSSTPSSKSCGAIGQFSAAACSTPPSSKSVSSSSVIPSSKSVPSSSVVPSSKPVSSSSVAPSSKSSSSSIAFTKLIEAEQYSVMSGIQTENTTDIGGGRNVGWIDSGDWLSYTNTPVDIPVTGLYDIEYRVASQSNGGNLTFEEAGGAVKYGSISFSATGGWQNWKTVKHQVTLTQGTHRFGINATSGGWNINWFQIRKAN